MRITSAAASSTFSISGTSPYTSSSCRTAAVWRPCCRTLHPVAPSSSRPGMRSRSAGASTLGAFSPNDARSMAGRRVNTLLISGPPLLYLLVFFAIPTLIMVLASFRYPGDFGGLAPLIESAEEGQTAINLTLENYQRFFSDALYAQLFLKSFGYAVVTTTLCLLIGYPLAMLIARSAKRHRDFLVLLVILPFWSNFLIRVYAWMIILGPQSVFVAAFNSLTALFGLPPVRLLFTPFAVVVGLVYVHLPFMVLPLY